MKLFISHSSKDADLARGIINLVQVALPVRPNEIRCTSVEGYGLPGGVKTDEVLRREVGTSVSFIGIISAYSLASMYVSFELGARWGAKRNLIPVLTPEIDPGNLSAPLDAINALQCSKRSHLFQLVTNLGKELELNPENPHSYSSHVDDIIDLTRDRDAEESARNTNADGSEEAQVGKNQFPNVFAASNGVIRVIASVPGTSQKEKTVNLTYLYALATEILTDEKRVSLDEIRQACKRHNCYNSSNFASYVKTAKVIPHGSASSMEIELTHPGRKKARELAEEMN